MLLFRFFSFSAVVRTGCHWQTNTFICRGYFGFYLVEDWVLDLRGEYRWRAYLVFSLYFVLIVPAEKLSYLSASSFGLNFIFLVYAGDDYRLCELVFSGFFVICLEIYILTIAIVATILFTSINLRDSGLLEHRLFRTRPSRSWRNKVQRVSICSNACLLRRKTGRDFF